MPRRARTAFEFVAALGIGLLGTAGVVGLSVGMNSQVQKKATEVATVIETVAAAPESKAKAQARKQRSSPVKKAARSAPSPTPALAANLGGLDFGLAGGADAAMMSATGALLQDVGTAVMNEDAVEVPPRSVERTPPQYPTRARSQGQTGKVTLSFIVDIDGSVQDVHVVEASPPGVFDAAAIEAVSSWRFEAGQNAGSPVAVRVRQTLRFELEG